MPPYLGSVLVLEVWLLVFRPIMELRIASLTLIPIYSGKQSFVFILIFWLFTEIISRYMPTFFNQLLQL